MLENPKVNIKLKLAALWASTTFCYIYGDYFELYTPGKVDSLLIGKNILDNPVKLLVASIILVVPSVMVAASVLLPPKVNRTMNIIFGAVFTIMMLFIGINSLTEWYSFYVFLAFVESILTFLIVRYAIKWPKPKDNG
ncbi:MULTISPECIES: DUF6326 family protein [Flavobacteriaceae]|jgi:hypothetical protein|uniref:DoxX-like family protein n=1 Tax=Flagellimonas taeanensis TaxID=1005926 RepID=A0A1M6T1B9_9FLAO|nr:MULTISPECIES: DUF6326 family protein [Allomuricauda]MAO17056.1 hypothetical protein [Allomuricauda sp.]RPG33038.1 MAG: hypothetical protein CBB72_010035 [Muricauda sp. TMED12]SFB84712.1 hypothetical protein SAMN04487891_10322 [Allomuricauda taeanensis]SHK50793.1 hypothetical protein SAMN05216293_1183 [Allomuricauda taeanensis]|tara:strand:- start:215 stop:628 length:414 start_codon:yes stop_codon:yes gene_type:complete